MIRFHCPYYLIGQKLKALHPVLEYAISQFGMPSRIVESLNSGHMFICKWSYEDVQNVDHWSQWSRSFALRVWHQGRCGYFLTDKTRTRFNADDHPFNASIEDAFEFFDLWQRYTDHAVPRYLRPTAFASEHTRSSMPLNEVADLLGIEPNPYAA